MKVLRNTEWRAFYSGCREAVPLQVHTGLKSESFDKHQDINGVHAKHQEINGVHDYV